MGMAGIITVGSFVIQSARSLRSFQLQLQSLPAPQGECQTDKSVERGRRRRSEGGDRETGSFNSVSWQRLLPLASRKSPGRSACKNNRVFVSCVREGERGRQRTSECQQ